MAALNFFDQFSEDLHSGVHNLIGGTDTLKVYLSNAAPNAATNAVKADLAEITNQNGYTAPVDIENGGTQSGGVTTITAVDKTITASGGTVGPFQYAVIYNDTPTSPLDPLVCWFDYGSAITLQDGESFTIDFGASLFTNTL